MVRMSDDQIMDQGQHEGTSGDRSEPAWVTPDGILFDGKYYSCRRAIRDGWYKQAWNRQPWIVRVMRKQDEAEMQLYIESDSFDPDCLCSELIAVMPEEEAAAYQARLRGLLAKRKLLMDSESRTGIIE